MKNNDIRTETKAAGIYLWQIAERLGLADSNFSKLLRHELSSERKEEIRKIIEELKKERS